jgi:hypothetical protein
MPGETEAQTGLRPPRQKRVMQLRKIALPGIIKIPSRGDETKTRSYLYWLYIAGCGAFVGYEWYSYTGLLSTRRRMADEYVRFVPDKGNLAAAVRGVGHPGGRGGEAARREGQRAYPASVNPSLRVVVLIGLVLVGLMLVAAVEDGKIPSCSFR